MHRQSNWLLTFEMELEVILKLALVVACEFAIVTGALEEVSHFRGRSLRIEGLHRLTVARLPTLGLVSSWRMQQEPNTSVPEVQKIDAVDRRIKSWLKNRN